MAAVCTGVGDLVGVDLEPLGQFVAQTCAVQCGQCGDAAGFNAAVEKRYQTRDVGRVENNNDVLYIRAIFLDVLTEVLGDLAVASRSSRVIPALRGAPPDDTMYLAPVNAFSMSSV